MINNRCIFDRRQLVLNIAAEYALNWHACEAKVLGDVFCALS